MGRFVEKKGYSYSLRALALLRARRPDLSFMLNIVGDGPLRSEIEAEVSALDLHDVVHFHGSLAHSDALALLDKAAIFILPSITSKSGDMEGIPVSLMEAMARSVPVISTRHSGIPELVEDGISGLLTPERDVPALAAAVERLIDQQQLRAEYGHAGRRKVVAQFNRRSLGMRLSDLYRALMPQAT
ncbi:MAG: glycosyltransferase [Rhodospirillaceae bacterium]|nr:glycosyltransferase [Rhodospirillaceae bacterium]